MIELYRGSVNTWECDEMGHMNVRFYVRKMMEGLALLAPHMKVPRAFTPNSSSTLLPYDQHIRFLREIRPGAPVFMQGGILDVTDDAVLVYQELRHTISGDLAASFRTWVRHGEAKSGKSFAWSDRSRAAFDKLRINAPNEGAPRSVDMSVVPLPSTEVRAETARNIGVPVIGRAAVALNECDAFGRMLPEMYIGRISDSVPNLMAEWRNQVANAASGDGQQAATGAAVLEYRLIYRRWPKAGDLIEVRSGLGQAGEKVHSLFHWLNDPVSGEAWCTAEAVAVTFDLQTRKVIAAKPEHLELLRQRAVSGLSL